MTMFFNQIVVGDSCYLDDAVLVHVISKRDVPWLKHPEVVVADRTGREYKVSPSRLSSTSTSEKRGL